MNSKTIQKCIICGNKKLRVLFKIKNAPFSVSKLLDRDQLAKDKKQPLTLKICDTCKLSQLAGNLLPSGFYNDYQMSFSYSRMIQTYQQRLAEDFIRYFKLNGKSAFEIGCGDGMFASFLNRKGLKTVGIEPSVPLYNLARKKVKALNQYFNKRAPLKKKHYDAFVSRQVFEHVDDPNKILQDAKEFLKPAGVGLIEVPSFSTIASFNRYYDICRDHRSYYTPVTLQYLLATNNFQVIKIFHTAHNEYITAYFKNNEYHQQELKSFFARYAGYRQSIKKLLTKYKGKKIAVWGAGGKGVTFLSICDIRPEDILFVIDSDTHKGNKYTTGSHILVKTPAAVEFNSIDLIIIAAVMFQEEIIKDLIGRYKYKNKIAVLSPYPHIL
ncbi:MAG: methyltransferase domain-containing protein [Candidatus Omnitrophica bacterium]|nr:methyltransferase domain-containing protein [Candidatus Omnitrophota bacterium]